MSLKNNDYDQEANQKFGELWPLEVLLLGFFIAPSNT